MIFHRGNKTGRSTELLSAISSIFLNENYLTQRHKATKLHEVIFCNFCYLSNENYFPIGNQATKSDFHIFLSCRNATPECEVPDLAPPSQVHFSRSFIRKEKWPAVKTASHLFVVFFLNTLPYFEKVSS